MRRGFTLMEALAAVITLGLLAAAVVPMLRQLGQPVVAERLQAQALLRSLATLELAPGTVEAVPGHAGWSLRVSELAAEAEPPPPPGRLPPAAPPHRWLLVGIHGAGGGVLAETVVAVVDGP